MIVPYSLIPAEYLEPLKVETTTEYTIEDDKFPGLNDDHHINQPALFVVPIHPQYDNQGLDCTIYETGESFQHDRKQLGQPTWIVPPIDPPDCEQRLDYTVPSGELEKTIYIEEYLSLPSQRLNSGIDYDYGHNETVQEKQENHQQWFDQQHQQQFHPVSPDSPRRSLSALRWCIDARETVIDLTDSPTEYSSSTSCNFTPYGQGNQTRSTDRNNVGILPNDDITSGVNESCNQSERYGSWSDYCTECVYANNEFLGQTVDKYYNEFLPKYQSHQNNFSIQFTGRKRVYPEESFEDSGMTGDGICPNKRRCETTVDSRSVSYSVDLGLDLLKETDPRNSYGLDLLKETGPRKSYVLNLQKETGPRNLYGLDLQKQTGPGNSYAKLTNVAKFWNNGESIHSLQFGSYLRDTDVPPNPVRPPCFRQC